MKMVLKSYRWLIILLGGFILCWPKVSEGQKNDYVWVSGYDSWAPNDSATYGFRFGNDKMDFNYEPVNIMADSLSMNFDFTNTSFCDNDGKLLLYTNGIYVANSNDGLIENGDSLNAGWLQYVWDTNITDMGYRNHQGIIALQDISNQNRVYLIYSFSDSLPGSDQTIVYTSKILTALVDMSENNGKGKVIYKNNVLVEGNLGSELTATKSSNGIDWWLLVQIRNTNCYYRVLVDSSGPHVLPDSICLGSSVSYNNSASVAFSPDGSKFAHFSIIEGLNIYDFNRCSGQLSNPVYIPMNIWAASYWLGNGVAFSPNSRFLYLSATEMLLQYDMQASDIPSSVDTVGIYDGWYLPNNPIFGSRFATAQLAPDGKIYISCGTSLPVYNVINNPDEKGNGCNFMQHSIALPRLSNGVPNFPNYRLGPSQCDSLSALSDDLLAAKEKILKVFPNPAIDYAVIDYGFTDWNKGKISLQISNELGQVVYTQALPMYSGFQKINVAQFAGGVYTVSIIRGTGVVATGKLVRE